MAVILSEWELSWVETFFGGSFLDGNYPVRITWVAIFWVGVFILPALHRFFRTLSLTFPLNTGHKLNIFPFVILHCIKMKLSTKDFFSKCDQICRKLRIWSHLLKKSLTKNFIFLCSVLAEATLSPFQHYDTHCHNANSSPQI